MRSRSIILYWLLLLIPTGIIGALAFQTLRLEQDRIKQQAKDVVYSRAYTLAESLQYTVAAVEEEMTQALLAIPASELTETLLLWQRRNPLVRNAFVWEPQDGLKLPFPGPSATTEEQQFMRRYQALLSGRIPWKSGNGPSDSDPSVSSTNAAPNRPSEVTDAQEQQQAFFESVRRQKKGRESLVSLAKGAPATAQTDSGNAEGKENKTGEWMPWFAENKLYILGWVRFLPEGTVYGVELEVMTLLSRLVSDFPSADIIPRGTAYALIDGNGQILHQAGYQDSRHQRRADISISLAPQLPHWQLAVYFAGGDLAAQTGRGFLILTGLLLAIFIVAILAGGALLTWQAYRNYKDASQKTTFVSNVSHELKTPLTSIRMYAELLSEGRVPSEEKKNRYLGVIVSESQRLTRLVNNVLDFSRLEQGRKTYRSENLDLTELLREAIGSQQPRISAAGMLIQKRIPEKAVMVHVDRDALRQVLLNLIDNALKYAADGKELVFDLKRYRSSIELSVADRGSGIPAEHREKIFTKFHRIDDSLTTQQPGSGLGLSIARRLLKDMGGNLYCRPREGGGSCFVLELPLAIDA